MKNVLILLTSTMFLVSCEKEISVDLNSSDPQVIIEGNITDQPGSHVIRISKSVNFSERNNFPAVTGATVTVSDNTGFSETLVEQSQGEYHTINLRGIPGRTYTMTVVAEGKTYTAESKMPLKVFLDTISFNKITPPGSGVLYLPVPRFQDPVAFGNQYRFVITVNGKVDKAYYVNNDNLNNGALNNTPIRSADAEIQENDSVTVELRCIDQPTYLYFFSLDQIAGNGPGGGTTPSNPTNNIKGNKALGYFAAYTIDRMGLTAK